MTELQFLLDLLLEHKLTVATKKIIKDRIKYVEDGIHKPSSIAATPQRFEQSNTSKVVPIETIAQTPAAAAALADRQKSIAIAASGTFEPGRTSPRKF